MKIPDSLKKVISSKVLKKAEAGDSKVSGLKELDNLSKNLSFLPNIAKDLNIARQNIFKLVKLEGGKPERASNVSAGKEGKSPSPVFRDQAPMKKKEPKEESSFEMGQRFASFFLDLFNPKKLLAKISIGAIFMAAGIITLFKDAFLGLADYLSDAIQKSFTKFVDYIGEWFKEVVKPIFAELTIFMEKIWTNIKDFFKPIFDWVAGKINTVLEFLEPIFNFIGDVFGKIMVYVNKFKETLTSLSDTYNSIQNQISAAKESLANASGPSSEVQYDAMGNVISDSGAQAATEQAQKKKEAEEAKKKEESAKAAAEAARKKKEADDAKAAAAAKAATAAKAKAADDAKAAAAAKAATAAKAKAAAPNAVPTNFGKSVNPYEGQTKTSSQTNASQGGRGGPTAADMAKKDLTPSQLKWLGDADPTDQYIMMRMPPPQPGEKGGPPKAPTPAPAPVPTPAPTKPAPTKPAAAPSGGGMSDSKQMIIRHEGKGEKVPGGYKPYKDTEGYWTIGVGHLITRGKTLPKEWDRVFTEAEIMKMFDEDYAHHAAAAAKIPGFNLLSPSGQDALIDMTFNMGNSWYKKFPKAIEALAKGDFKTAADEFTDSDWYKQVKGRAVTIVAMIRNSMSAAPVKGDTQVAKAETLAPAPAAPAPAKPAAPAPAKPAAPKLPPTPADPPISGEKPGQKSFKDFFKLGSGETIAGLQPGLVERMTAMGEAFFKTTGTKLLVTSGYRSNEEQKELYDEWVRGGKKGKIVSKPKAPLAGIDGMSGSGSPHSKGTAIDINSKGPEGINVLAGPANKSTGFLEKFGLTRPVFSPDFKIGGKPISPDKDENWHIVAAGTPVGGPDGGVVPSKGGGEIDPSTGKNVTLPPPMNDTGKNINAESTNIAADQRAQQKSNTPVVIDASTTNNSQVTKNESGSKKQENTNKKLLERVT